MERPKIDKQIIEQAARATALQTSNIDKDDVDQLAADIARVYSTYMNGYQLSKELEHFGWDIDSMFVEDMDGMWCHIRQLHDKAQKLWAEQENIQPPHPIGTHTTNGEIVGIYEHGAAKYLILPPGQDDAKDGHRRLILNFEDVVLDK